jgi:RNA 3'-terminal phosphate cyclase (ATP)
MRLPVEIDGSRGEGGGQILRTSLALSVITGRKLRMRNIRAGRKRPGLQRQHLACVEAAAQLCRATTNTLEVGSSELVFTPGPNKSEWPGELAVDIGTAGSTTLVVQTVLLPAIVGAKALHARITGGTHNPFAPPFEFLDRVFLPHLRAMGADVTLTLVKHGFMPSGGGAVELDVKPSGKLKPLEIVEAGRIVARKATAICASLPRHVGEREIAVAQERLDHPACEVLEFPKAGPHNVFMVEVELASGARELVTSQGRKGYPAEDVADDALDDLEDYLEAGVPVGEHLSDQLLLPMALAGKGRFRTLGPLSRHATTNIETIREFLDVPIDVAPVSGTANVDVVFG